MTTKGWVILAAVIIVSIVVAGIAQSKLSGTQTFDNGYNYAGEEYQ